MWQRFTERARRVILLGQEEAGKLSAGHVGTEHLLLGLMREREGAGAIILGQMGADYEAVRALIRAESEGAPNAPQLPEPKLTPKAKRILELAADEARRMRHNYIGTEHLLIALLRERDGLAAKILGEMGLDVEKARVQVLSYLGPESGQAAAASTASSAAPAAGEKWQEPNDKIIVSLLQQILASDNMALKLLVASGLDAQSARERVQKFLAGEQAPPST